MLLKAYLRWFYTIWGLNQILNRTLEGTGCRQASKNLERPELRSEKRLKFCSNVLSRRERVKKKIGSVPGRKRPIFGSKKCPKRVRITFVRAFTAMSYLTSQSLHIIRFAVQRLESRINENLRIG